MDKFADLDAFTAVVESGTFSAAGERLGIAKSVVSRRVSQLENRLGSRLLNRTTRRLGVAQYVTCASPAYLREYGEPTHPCWD
ncbi:Transcriptional regulator, LysR family [hydrothermal vent metagenome]|uniref:Transcriptional regulator, LysR family n=1 Tax=hydrothermal vent metagenome TaxID=652676 RepID=A0A3B0Y711_9ZZZZ